MSCVKHLLSETYRVLCILFVQTKYFSKQKKKLQQNQLRSRIQKSYWQLCQRYIPGSMYASFEGEVRIANGMRLSNNVLYHEYCFDPIIS